MSLLGRESKNGSRNRTFLGYAPSSQRPTDVDPLSGPQAVLELLHDGAANGREPRAVGDTRRDGYWKIGVCLPDVDSAVQRLLEAGMAVGQAVQFQDIGYLTHLADPDDYTIELLQHTFEGTTPVGEIAPHLPLASVPHLGQITLRVRDIEASLEFYGEALGMRLMSRQAVDAHGFTLYFLAYSDEPLPIGDIDSVAIREWLWQRPYTVLELQHYHERADFRSARECGFERLGLFCSGRHSRLYDYAKSAASTTGYDEDLRLRTFDLSDPDDYPVRVYSR